MTHQAPNFLKTFHDDTRPIHELPDITQKAKDTVNNHNAASAMPYNMTDRFSAYAA